MRYIKLYEDLKEGITFKDLINDPEYSWIFDQESNGFFGLK